MVLIQSMISKGEGSWASLPKEKLFFENKKVFSILESLPIIGILSIFENNAIM
jgi:hypothetical protein